MSETWNISVASIAGLLLVLGGLARANEADTLIEHLAAQAREQAAAHQSEDVKKTLGEISRAVPNASLEGITATDELLSYLDDLRRTEQSRATGSIVAPEPEIPAGQPVAEGPQARQPAPPPAETAEPSPPPGASASAPVVPRKPDLSYLPAMVKATAFANNGDIASARNLYRFAAERGNLPQAMVGLGRTYDPRALREMNAVGIAPNVAEARRWYERAASLGDEDAKRLLGALPDH